jgi:hypothetical protein
MADARAFEFVCDALERETSLDRLAARGTVRIALKQAGLDPRTVTRSQLLVALEKLLPGELTSRGVADAASVCARLRDRLATLQDEARPETADAIFARLGGR